MTALPQTRIPHRALDPYLHVLLVQNMKSHAIVSWAFQQPAEHRSATRTPSPDSNPWERPQTTPAPPKSLGCRIPSGACLRMRVFGPDLQTDYKVSESTPVISALPPAPTLHVPPHALSSFPPIQPA